MRKLKVALMFFVLAFVVWSVKAQVISLKSDGTYSSDLSTTLTVGDTLYIQLDTVQAWHSGAGNDSATVIVSNTSSGDKITVALTEALENIFRGTASIGSTTSGATIAASSNDTLVVKMVPPSMIEDGQLTDWSNALFQHIEDISDQNYDASNSRADVTNIWVTSDNDFVYLLYEMENDFNDTNNGYDVSCDSIFDIVPSAGTSSSGDYAPWWIWMGGAPVGSGFADGGMLADYAVRSYFTTSGAGAGYFGDASTVNHWDGSAWQNVGVNKPAGGFAGDFAKQSGHYVEVQIPFTNIGRPTNWCGVTFKIVNTLAGGFHADIVPDDSVAAPRNPVWFKPAMYVKTFVNITSTPVTNTPSTNTNNGTGTAITYSDLADVVAYPTIVKESKKIVFDKLSDTAKIKIYTLTGELVKELNDSVVNGKIEWDFSNMNLAHGIYIAYITDDKGNKKIEKFIYQK